MVHTCIQLKVKVASPGKSLTDGGLATPKAVRTKMNLSLKVVCLQEPETHMLQTRLSYPLSSLAVRIRVTDLTIMKVQMPNTCYSRHC